VRIDHGGGVETLYAHLSRVDVTDGQTISPGQQVGAVGDLGNTTGPHLHFEVRLDGLAVDPTQVLDVPEAPRATYPNGEVPAEALCAATSDGVQQLRCDAAVAYRLMSAAFEEDNGETLCITDSYRSRAGQEQVHVLKPGLTATPGTSVHGWGLAVDLCGGVESFSSTEHAWMIERGPTFGWTHPSWAGAGGSRPEPWHFEYEG
jgi:LAS superfamily LD-carboxypeptidase LdcB